MLQKCLKITIAAFLLTVFIVGTASAVMYGCWRCRYSGGVGIAGPSRIECEMVNPESWGEGWKCEEDNFGELGTSCVTNNQPCYRIDVRP